MTTKFSVQGVIYKKIKLLLHVLVFFIVGLRENLWEETFVTLCESLRKLGCHIKGVALQ